MGELRSVKLDYSLNDVETRVISRTRIYVTPKFTVNELKLNNIPIEFLFDTGAMTVTMPASKLGLADEEEFTSIHKVTPLKHYGIVKTAPIIYYEYYIDKLAIGDIVINHFPVHITFDKTAPSALFGMSIIGLFSTQIDPIACTVTLTETPELAEYTHNNIPLPNPLEICKNEFIDLLDQQSLEANYINKLIHNENENTDRT